MILLADGIFAALYFGPGAPTPIGIHPADGFRTDRLRSLSFDFVADDTMPYIVTSAIYEGDPGHGPSRVDHITHWHGQGDEEIGVARGLLGQRIFHMDDTWDRIMICDGYSLGDFGRAALRYVNETLGGVPERSLLDEVS